MDMPPGLTDRAQEIWLDVTTHLSDLGVLAEMDANAIARYCQNLDFWERCREHVAKYGEGYPIKAGDGIKCFQHYPQASRMSEYDRLCAAFEKEFGLTPASRRRNRIRADKAAKASRKANKLRTLKVVRAG